MMFSSTLATLVAAAVLYFAPAPAGAVPLPQGFVFSVLDHLSYRYYHLS